MITKIWYDNHCSGKENNNSKTTMIDITNQKFGKWTVLYPTDKRNVGGAIYWHCRCDCGTEKDILGTSLRQGRSLSCGLHSNISKGNVKIAELLEDIQQNMYDTCKKRMEAKTTIAHNLEEFKNNMDKEQGFIKTMWCGSAECEEKIKDLTGAKSRCMPFEQEHLGDTCVCCGKKADKMVVWGRQY